MPQSSAENWDTQYLVCLTSHNYDPLTNYIYGTANWSFVGGTSNNKNINCSGTETYLIDCPVQTLSYIPSCTYILLKCREYTLPTGRPIPVPTFPLTPVTSDSHTSLTGTQTTTDSGTLQTPVPTDSGTSLTSSQSTVPEVVNSPDITAPQSTSEDGPPLAALATATSLVAVVIIIIAVILLIALIIYKRNKLNQQKHRYVILFIHKVFFHFLPPIVTAICQILHMILLSS